MCYDFLSLKLYMTTTAPWCGSNIGGVMRNIQLAVEEVVLHILLGQVKIKILRNRF